MHKEGLKTTNHRESRGYVAARVPVPTASAREGLGCQPARSRDMLLDMGTSATVILVHTTRALMRAYLIASKFFVAISLWNRCDSATGARMLSSRTVANHLVRLAQNAGRSLTPMQVLKLVFLCHGWMLGLYGRPLIRDRIEAWKYGPVIPDLYHAVKRYRNRPVEAPVNAPRERLDAQQDHLIGQVFDIYGDWTGEELSHLTHERGSPWDQVFDDDGWGLGIPTGVIKDYYARQARQAG